MEAMPLLPQTWAGYLLTALVGICLWVARGVKADVKELQTAQGKTMTREEIAAQFKATEDRTLLFEQRQLAMHTQNTDNFREVRLQLEAVNTKLFQLAKDKNP